MKLFNKAEMGGAMAVIWVVAILAGVYLFVQYQTPPGATIPSVDSSGQPIDKSLRCSYAPTVNLGANDKYSGGQSNWGSWAYKLNGGSTTSDADGSFEVPSEGEVALQVLVADGNSSNYYRAVWEPSIHCGLNPVAYDEVVKYGSYEVKCFNDINQPINGTTYFANYANYSVGTGGSITSECRLTTTAKTGVPYGALVILEMNSSTYKENEVGLQWEGAIAPLVTQPGAYTLGASTGATRTFEVPPFGGKTSQIVSFIVTAQAETSINPGPGYASPSDYGAAIVGYIIPKNCYEEEDVTPTEFKCGYEDLDTTFTSPGGTAKGDGAIASFAIPVQ